MTSFRQVCVKRFGLTHCASPPPTNASPKLAGLLGFVVRRPVFRPREGLAPAVVPPRSSALPRGGYPPGRLGSGREGRWSGRRARCPRIRRGKRACISATAAGFRWARTGSSKQRTRARPSGRGATRIGKPAATRSPFCQCRSFSWQRRKAEAFRCKRRRFLSCSVWRREEEEK